MAERVQQGKLAALGRLSASIAHEIRNPVGAMSHAGQLLAESPAIGPDERRLTDIIRNNSERVSAIINNVLQLSRREPPNRSACSWSTGSGLRRRVLRNHAGAACADRVLGRRAGLRGALRSHPFAPGRLEPVRQRDEVRKARRRPVVEMHFGRLTRATGPTSKWPTAAPASTRRRRSHLRAVLHRPQRRHGARAVHLARTVPAEPRAPAVRAARRRRQHLPHRVPDPQRWEE